MLPLTATLRAATPRFSALTPMRRLSTVPITPPSRTGLRLAVGGLAAAGVFGLGMLGAAIGDSSSSSGINVKLVGDSPRFSSVVRSRLRDTFGAFAGGLVVTAGVGVMCWRSGMFLTMSPWILLGGSVAALFGTMMVPPENRLLKLAAFSAFTGITGVSLAPLAVLGGPVVMRAALLTAGMVGSLGFVAANSPSEQFLWMGGPLALGLGAVVVASLGTMVLPAGGAAASIASSVSMYGGLALFSGFVLYDTSKILYKAENSEKYDPVNEALSIYLDSINIFVRVAMMLGGNKRK